MKRKPKFRGRRANGQWVRGLLCHDPRMGRTSPTDWFISNCLGSPHAYSVDPSTIGQWTGMVDKKGAEIYEGDIVRVGYQHKLVVYIPEEACFSFKDELPLSMYRNIPMRVVGNIHDHPHLLKEVCSSANAEDETNEEQL